MRVAVIGLGIIGLSVCLRLARAGHDVSGFEQFAQMHALGSSHGDTRIMRLTPGEGPIYVRMAARANEAWMRWQDQAGEALIQWTGGLMAGPAGSAFVRNCAAFNQGSPAALLRGDTIYYMTRGAMALPREWDVCRQEDVGVTFADKTRAFLIKRAQELGAKLHDNVAIAAPVTSRTLTINGEAQTFDAVIVAAGPWAGRVLPEFAPHLVVRRRVIGWLKPKAEHAPPPVLCCDDEYGLFGMPTPDGLYKIGMHVVGDRVDPDQVAEPNEEDAAMLAAMAEARLPLYEPQPVRMARCLYTLTPDDNFLMAPSQHDPRILIMSCCSGHGFKYAPIYGTIVKRWLDDASVEELDAFGVKGRIGEATGLGQSPQ
ncbi:MAG: FAD-dependent oxidoreductase [Hyphomonadaceae bacterium]